MDKCENVCYNTYMKKKIWKILNIILCVCLFMVGGVSLCLSSASKGKRIESSLTVTSDGTLSSTQDKIKILQLADMQFSTYFQGITAFQTAKKAIDKAKPDMLVLTGDNVNNDSKKKQVEMLSDFLDSFEIPWALVMGNHDYYSRLSMDEQCEIYENAKYSLFKKGDVENSYGNYAYTVKLNGSASYALIFMDSGITGFEQKHVTWYARTVSTLQMDGTGNKIKSGVFFHIPTQETVLAYEKYLEDKTLGDGVKNEEFCVQETNVGLYAKAKEFGSTNAFIYGHDHINNLVLDYNGIKLCYGLKCGKNSYYQADMLGGNLYTIKKDGSLKVDRIYV